MKNILAVDDTFKKTLNGKVIVVTGAGSGLGRALAIGLSYYGATIGLLDINETALKETAQILQTKNFQIMKASVTNEEELKLAYSELIKKFKKIDGLVNCAGIARLGKINELTQKDIELSNAININGYFLNTKIASNYFIQQKSGNIINISSASARGASEGSSLYGVAKEAQNMMTRSWALDLGSYGIKVNSILAGDLYGDENAGITSAIWSKDYFNKKAVDKNLVEKNDKRLFEEKLNPSIRQKVVEHYMNRTALKKEVTYSDIVEMATFLLSDLSKKITGESIAITSGNPSAFSR
jgi:NAD(P)-dependent dehydrogenase (short-subunit alcohol dehydrogenase family)